MRANRFVLFAVLACGVCAGTRPAAAAEPPSVFGAVPANAAKVMMLGVFHFANPGRDLVKSGVIDVMTPANQAYLQKLATRIAAFRPTDVLIECEPSQQSRYDADYAAYQADTFKATSNENHQLGFRVAKAAGLKRVTCFDEGKVGWEAEPMMAYIKAHEPQTQAALDAAIQALSGRESREQATLSLGQLLLLSNDPARDRENKAFYLATNAVDAGASFAGADAAASWWHRNFRMYANVQRAAMPGHRVLVIAGAGHTAILKDLLAIDTQRQAADVRPLLSP
jgi:hypothetical protein